MKLFVVERSYDETFWEDCMSAVVIAEDAKHAERHARININDFRKCKLKVREIDLNKEQIIMKEYKCF